MTPSSIPQAIRTSGGGGGGSAAVIDPTTAPYNCVLNNSSGTVAAANTTGFQAALNAAGLLGGGIIQLPAGGTLWLAKKAASVIGGVAYCTYMRYDNVEVWGHGPKASILGTKDDASVIVVSGALKASGPGGDAANNPKRAPITPINTATVGSGTVTVTGGTTELTRLGITVGDDILVQSGQCIPSSDMEPDGEVHTVAALPGSGVIQLSSPLLKPYNQEYYPAGVVTTTTINGSVSAGASSLIVADASGLVAAGWINAGGSWVSYSSKSGNTLSGLRNVPSTGIANVAAVYQGNGTTSTTSTAYPARLGVARVTGAFLRGAAFRHIGFDAQSLTDTGGGVIEGGYTLGMTLEDVSNVSSRPLKLHTMAPRFHAKGVTSCHIGGGYYHDLGVDTCSTGCVIEDFDLTSDGIGFIHNHEGSECRIRSGRIRNTGLVAGNANVNSNAISIRSRNYGSTIDDVTIIQPAGFGPGITVDGTCVRGGTIGNGVRFIGSMTSAILMTAGAVGWYIGDVDLQLATSAKVTVLCNQFRSNVRRLSAWMIFDASSSGGAQGNITASAASVPLGVLPANCRILSAAVQVDDVFDGTGTNTISVGWAASHTAVATATAAGTSATTTYTLGSSGAGAQIGVYRNTAQTLTAYYNGTSGVNGSAYISVEYEQAQQKP